MAVFLVNSRVIAVHFKTAGSTTVSLIVMINDRKAAFKRVGGPNFRGTHVKFRLGAASAFLVEQSQLNGEGAFDLFHEEAV